MLVSEVVQRWRPVEVRYYLISAHYRSMIEYSEAALGDAAAAYRRIETFVDKAAPLIDGWTAFVPKAFADAMDDDFGVPAALGVLHEMVRAGNTALAAGDKEALTEAFGQVARMTSILGIWPPDWQDRGRGDLAVVVDSLVGLALEQRTAARERKDFAAADKVRDQLAAAGVFVEDTPSGPRWTLRDG
jgi:cysteinyl-tRNA synthetase